MTRVASLALAAAIALTAVAAEDPPAKPVPVAFGDDLAAAQKEAREAKRPLLVLVVPTWFESPEAARLDAEVLATDDARRALDPFVRVRLREGEEREVHARHRDRFDGYPLAVVLDPEGAFLGSVSGLPAEEVGKTWCARVASIPPRAQRMKELRALLAAKPEDPQALFDLALLHVEAAEPDRALPLFERMEAAAPDGPLDRLGEARYQVLRIQAVRALAERRFGDVDPACQKWLRRFASHPRAPDALLLQANALFLAGEKDRATEIWKTLAEKHAGTDAARRAKAALDGL